MGLEYLQRRRLHNLPGQPGPGLRHPQREEVLPPVQLELPLLQFVPKQFDSFVTAVISTEMLVVCPSCVLVLLVSKQSETVGVCIIDFLIQFQECKCYI